MPILLDTCVLLWMVGDPARLSAKARNALSQENRLCISAISAFEIAIKHKKKKLELPISPWAWFQKATAHFQIQEIPISAQIAALAPEIDVPHADPGDRIILASAITLNLTILSPDHLIGTCQQANVLW